MGDTSDRILGIDYGRRRIGVAVSAPGRRFAEPLRVLEVRTPEEAIPAIAELAAHYGAERVVVGIPIRTDGREGEMAAEVRAWGERLAANLPCEVVYYDERFTSLWADRVHAEVGLRGRKAKRRRDAVAAAALLEDYLRNLEATASS